MPGVGERSEAALLVVAKRPAPGRTKTRLSPPLSAESCASLYECFLRDTLGLMRALPGVRPAIAYLPVEARSYFTSLAPDMDLLPQEGEDLGARLDNALSSYLRLGYARVAIMNSDGPTLPLGYLVEAFEALAGQTDVVLGPCDDGGYYLIGLKQSHPGLLRGVPMSTPHTARDTLAVAARMGLRVHLLPTWYDIDDAAGLARLVGEMAVNPNGTAPHTRAFLERHAPAIAAAIAASACEGRASP